MDAKRYSGECWEASARLNPVLRAATTSSGAPAPTYYASPACQAEEQWLQMLRDHFQRQQQELAMMEQQEVKQLRAEHFKQLEKLEYQHYRERDRFESETCRQQVEQMEQQQREHLRHLQQLYEDVKRKLPIKQEEYLRHVQMQQTQCCSLQPGPVCSCDAAQASRSLAPVPTTATTSHRSQEELEELESIAQVALRSMLGAKSPTKESNSTSMNCGEPSASVLKAEQPEESSDNKDPARFNQQWFEGQRIAVARPGQDGRSGSLTGLRKLEPSNTNSTQQFKDSSTSLRFKLPTLTQMQQPRVFRA